MADGTKKSQIPPEEGEEEYYYEEVMSTEPSQSQAQSEVPESQAYGSEAAGSQLTGSQLTGSQMPGSQMPGSQMPGSAAPGSAAPGTAVPGSGMPGSAVPGSGMPKSGEPGSGVPGSGVPGSGAEESQYEYVEYSTEEAPSTPSAQPPLGTKSAKIKVVIRSTEMPKFQIQPPPAPMMAPIGGQGIVLVEPTASAPRIKRRKKGEKVTLSDCRIGFLGAGKIAEYIVKGLINVTQIDSKRIFISTKSGRNHDTFEKLGCFCTKRNYDIFGRLDCDIVFLAFHGYVIKNLYRTGGTRPMALTTNYIPNQRHPIYILSLVGGCTIEEIKPTLLNPDNPTKYRLEMHRIVLNYPVSIGLGLGAIDVEPDSKKCGSIIRDLLTSMSKLEYFPENNMDVICCLGGNGLAFVFYFLAALSDGACKMGLPRQQGDKIAAKTLASAAASLLESGKHPSDLRDACTSPSGPAIYGLHVLDRVDCASGISMAVEAAFQRLKELAERSQ